jgi:uncharacterized protein with NRDE domain
MCLLVLAWKAHPRYRLVLAANRDEYHDRPSEPLHKWDGNEHILGGRDQRAGGTWLAVDRHRRLGVVTNYRDLQTPKPGAPSRGELIPAYLGGTRDPMEFAAALLPRAASYSGFNLLLADRDTLAYAANRAPVFARALRPGVYGLSNQLLDTPWPKLARVRRRFETLLPNLSISTARLFEILQDREPAALNEGDASETIPAELAAALSAPFVLHPLFGTRCSTVVMIEPSGALEMIERRFDAQGVAQGDSRFTFAPAEW